MTRQEEVKTMTMKLSMRVRVEELEHAAAQSRRQADECEARALLDHGIGSSHTVVMQGYAESHRARARQLRAEADRIRRAYR